MNAGKPLTNKGKTLVNTKIMKREIKFRVWDKGSKTMYFPCDENSQMILMGDSGFYQVQEHENFDIRTAKYRDLRIVDSLEDDLEIMLFTYQKDKNGIDAYFDDICHLCKGYGFDGGIWRIEQSEYGEPLFVDAYSDRPDIFKISFRDYFSQHGKGNFEVIGNFHSNPELLQGK